MADIKRLLKKKGWTGRELGILELTNMAVMFRQALEGKEPQSESELTKAEEPRGQKKLPHAGSERKSHAHTYC